MGRFDNLLQSGGGAAALPSTNRFSSLTQPKPAAPQPGFFKKAVGKVGGVFGKIGRVLSVGQQAITGTAEFGLEKAGVLKPTGASPLKAIKSQESNIDLLHRIGQETGKGGVFTGQYKPTQSVFGNFVHELPSTELGTIADLFADPLVVLSKLKVIGKATKAIGETGKAAYEIGKEVPAVEKIGNMLGKALFTRFGQRSAFSDLDIARKVEESLAQEKIGKLVSPIIEKPQFIQQRISQIIKGGVTEDSHLKFLAQPIREELDRVGEAISKLNPKLLSEDTFLANKGTYFPRLYTKYEVPDPADLIKNVFSGRAVSIPKGPFKQRLTDFEFAKSIKPDLVDTETKIRQINERVADMVTNRKDKIAELSKTINNLSTKGLKLSLKQPAREAFQELSAVLESKTGSYFRKVSQSTKEGKKLFTQVGVKELTYYQPTLGGKALKRNIEKLIFAPDKEIESIQRLIGNKDVKISKIFEDIKDIRKTYNEKIGTLPSLGEIKTLAEQARTGLGEIQTAGLPSLKGLTQLSITEQRQKFFSEVAKLASDEARPGWLQLSDDKALGNLAGKFLPAAEYNAIAQLRRVPTQVEQIYGKALSLWKTYKTAYNPATIARNDLTNFFVLNPLGGVGPLRLDIYARAAHELIIKGPLYEMARKEGLNISTQQAAELTQNASRFYRENKGLVSQFFGKVGDFHEAVKNFYGSQDKFFKLANFIKGVQKDGMTATQAMKRANFYLVDYSEAPQLVQWLRKSPVGIPFISFTYGVSKPLAKTLLEHPDKLSAYYKILNGIQSMNPVGETKQELQQENDVLPDWIQHGTYLRLPWRDKIGRSQYVDLQYILPFDLIESNKLTPSNPVFNWTAALLTNKDPYFQKEIWKDTDSQRQKMEKGSAYVLRQFFPAFTPLVGTSYDKIKNAIQKRPDKSGFVKDNLQVLLDVLGGIKITPIDPTLEAQKRAAQKGKLLRDLQSQLRLIMIDKSLFPEEKQRQSQEIRDKMQQVTSE
jgi:hypothetical protein